MPTPLVTRQMGRLPPTSTKFPWLLAAVLPLLLASCSDDASEKTGYVPTVRVATAATVSDVVTVSGTGEVKPRVESVLSFKVSGRVIARDVEVGDRVKVGQVLARLDPTEQKADLTAAEAAIRARQATLRTAESYLNRRRTLTQTGALPQQQLDEAIQQYDSAVNDLDAAQANLASVQESLAQTELKADADGLITAVSIEPGEVVQPSSAAFELAHDGELDAVFNVDESALTRDAQPESVEVALVDRPDIRAVARIQEISPSVDRKLGTVRLKLSITDPPPEITLGSAIVAYAKLSEVGRISIPSESLTSDNGKPAVFVVDPATEAVETRQIEVLRYDADRIIVANGLEPGDQFVVEGAQFLYPKQKVRTVQGDAQ
ncbi:efflux RND transporter periplasmic adaptor subunit [Allorhizobium sp. NPDC080224]|uniref:efflux RND transporter periplasmic adaptor subunit n=1 Tax=Allorhizobium sp. NPDC080224 TaxID=3390547 RepID=UPI003CFEFD26